MYMYIYAHNAIIIVASRGFMFHPSNMVTVGGGRKDEKCLNVFLSWPGRSIRCGTKSPCNTTIANGSYIASLPKPPVC